jgi:sugar phosphate isomerase/epimerase
MQLGNRLDGRFRLRLLAVCTAVLSVFAASCPGGPATAAEARTPANWRLGAAAWTFRDVTFLEAIAKTAGLGLTAIEAYEGQKLAPDSDAKLGSELSAADLARIKAALEKHRVAITSIYIHSIPGDRAQAEKIFDRVKQLGAGMIVSEPASRDLAAIEPLCEQYGIDLALHNHPTEQSEYRDPAFVAEVCKGRGPRIGACCDIGHWQRRGIDTVAGLQTLAGRIFSLHMKDLDRAKPDGHDVPWGTGEGRIADVLAELARQHVDPRIIAVEYEYNVGKSLPEIARCVAFYRSAVAGCPSAPASFGRAGPPATSRPTGRRRSSGSLSSGCRSGCGIRSPARRWRSKRSATENRSTRQ